jgi:hypothetical protein
LEIDELRVFVPGELGETVAGFHAHPADGLQSTHEVFGEDEALKGDLSDLFLRVRLPFSVFSDGREMDLFLLVVDSLAQDLDLELQARDVTAEIVTTAPLDRSGAEYRNCDQRQKQRSSHL